MKRILRDHDFTVSESIALKRASAAFATSVFPTVLPLDAKPKIVATVGVPLRTVKSSARRVTFSTLPLLLLPTSGASEIPLALATRTVDHPPADRVFVPVFAEPRPIDLWHRSWFRREGWKRPVVGRNPKNRFDVSTMPVDLNRHGFKMIRPDTVADSAKMIDFVPFGDWPHLVPVRESLRGSLRPSSDRRLDGKRPVPVITSATCPQPATGIGLPNSRPEATLFGVFVHRRIVAQNEVTHCE